VVAANTTSSQQWSFYDFMATAADIAGLNVPGDLPVDQRDGYSIVSYSIV